MQNLNKVPRPDGRRQVLCRESSPNHGQVVSLFTPFQTVADWFRNEEQENVDAGNFHDS